jgi:hypothetical protein
MPTALRRRLVALAGAAALSVAVAVPGAALADRGGVPHNPHMKPCPSKSKGNGPKKDAPNDKGKKCGFHRGNSNGENSV